MIKLVIEASIKEEEERVEKVKEQEIKEQEIIHKVEETSKVEIAQVPIEKVHKPEPVAVIEPKI